MVKTILSVFTLKTSMNKILLISVFSILTLNIMAQEKIIQTADVPNWESSPPNLQNSMTMSSSVKYGTALTSLVCVIAV